MLRIGIDCRFAVTQSGLGRYTRELVSHLLRRMDPITYTLFVRSVEEAWIRELKESLTTYNLQPTTYPHYSISEQTLFPIALRRSGIDLFFSPHFNIPFACPVPVVMTIHDCILHQYPNHAPLLRRLGYRLIFREAIRHAARIVCVSRAVVADVTRIYGERVCQKICVVPEGVSAAFFPRPLPEQGEARRMYGLSLPFFLYIGSTKEHKNVQCLIDAFLTLPVGRRELVLIVGREVQHLRLGPGVRILPTVAEEDLPALYSAADAFVTATLAEGFCLPITEALACGCPVIASSVGAIPEILAGRGCLVDPTPAAFAEAFARWRPPSQRSVQWDRRWEKVAEDTVGVLQGFARQHPRGKAHWETTECGTIAGS